MKIYNVKIDNNPGGWKSGEDHTILVIANTPEEAIQKVYEGWSEKYDFDNNCIIYGNNKGYGPFISDRAILSATEVIFQDCEILIGKSEIRKQKLNKLNDN
jgi:hypothetical protein